MSENTAGDGHALSLSEADMRRLGYAIVDFLVDHHAKLGTRPLIRTPDGSNPGIDIAHRPIPGQPSDPLEVLDRVVEQVLTDVKPVSDPRFFAYIPGPGNFVGAMADALASGVNIFAGTVNHNHGPTQVETAAIRWLCDLAGLPAEAGGTFVSGGSAANLTAMVLAREKRLTGPSADGVVYCSEETHSSVARGMRILGFAPDQLARIPTDADFRIDVTVLEERILRDQRAGRRPFLVIGNAGTTNTGAVDDLAALAAICEREALWFHVDAAYGGSALLVEELRSRFSGIERAHSVTMDQHKWFFQPFECASILIRDMAWLHEVFHIEAAYLKDSALELGGVNYRDYGIQLTRGLRALKLWMSLQVFGEDAFRTAVKRGLALARYAGSLLAADETWRIFAPPDLAIVVFRYERDDLEPALLDRLNEAINRELVTSGLAFTSTTELDGQKCLRLCTINPRCDETRIRELIAAMKEIGDRHVDGGFA